MTYEKIETIINECKPVSTYVTDPKNNVVRANFAFEHAGYRVTTDMVVEYDKRHESIDVISTKYSVNPSIPGFDDAMCRLGGRLDTKIDLDAIFAKFE